ncbi:hypothetical protein [Scytonema hofmannii]|nr:hypothetical protein [Scytonema hofmannii]
MGQDEAGEQKKEAGGRVQGAGGGTFSLLPTPSKAASSLVAH